MQPAKYRPFYPGLSVLTSWALFHYRIRLLIVRSRRASKPRGWYLDSYDRSEIWEAPRQQCCGRACQISKRCDDSTYQSRGSETLSDIETGPCTLSITCLQLWWYQQTPNNEPMRQNGGQFADDILKLFFSERKCWYFNWNLVKFVPEGPIVSKFVLIYVMAFTWTSDDPSISNYIHYKVWDEIVYPFPKLQRCNRWSLGMDK